MKEILENRIVTFFSDLPHIHDEQTRKALIFRASLDKELQDQISYSGTTDVFCSSLAATLMKYGTLQDGRDAIEAVLDAAKEQVGQEGKETGTSLIQEREKSRLKTTTVNLSNAETKDSHAKKSPSTFVPGHKHDIFVSYAHIDNKPAHGVKEGWVTTLIQGLKTELARRLGQENFSLWIDHKLAGNVPITSEIMENLRDSATLIVVLSQGYLASTWCQQEKGDFLRAVQERCRAHSRVFVIEVDESERPPEFGNLRGYRFFKQLPGKRYPQVLGWPEPRLEDQEYYDMINELSYELADELRRLKDASTKSSNETTSTTFETSDTSEISNTTIFLAEVTGDLYHLREAVKRYLLQNKFHVLPKINYSLDKTYQNAACEDLAKSDLFVQLLSDVPDKTSPELPQGYVRCQYELAKDMGKPILQWRSPKLPIDDAQDVEHRDLLQSYTVFAVGIEEFKAEIIKKAVFQKKTSVAGDNLGCMIFLDANAHEDATLVNTISELLTQFQVGYFLPLQSELPSENQKAFEEHILNSDALMIVYGKVSVYWVNNQLIQIRKILLAHTHNIQTFAVFIGPPEEKPPLPFNFPGLQIIECRNHLDRQKLIEFIKSIQRRETP